MVRTRNYVIAFAAGTVVAVALAWAFIAADHRRVMSEWRAWLSGTANNRANLVAAWLDERLADARVTALRPLARATLRSPAGEAVLRPGDLDSLARYYGYQAVALIHRDGRVATGSAGTRLNAGHRRVADSAMRQGTVLLRLVGDSGAPSVLTIAAPVHAADGRAVLGAVLLLISPHDRLFPLVLREAGRLRTGQTILARIEGDFAHLIAATWPAERSGPPTMRLDTAGAARRRLFAGHSAFERYVDYDGVDMLASAANVPGTNWVLVLKAPAEEALAPFHHNERLVLTALALAVVAWGLFLRVLVRRAEAEERKATTVLRTVEEELHRSEERYRALVEGARDVIFVIDVEGRLAWLNPAFEDMTGWPRDEWIGRRFEDLVAPADRAAARLVFANVMGLNAPRPTVQLRLTTRDGGTRLGEFTGTPQVKDDRVVGVLGVCRDVTERAQLEQQLRQSSRMEAVGQLAGGIAHDFNNLLTVIIGSCELLLADIPEGNPWRADVSEIRAAAGRAAMLTRQLLAFSRRQMLAPRLIDLNSLVTDAAGMLRRLIGEHITLDVRLGRAIGTVRADSTQLEQAIVNLAVNARDAMPRGGTLSITTAELHNDEPVPVGTARLPPGHWCVLEVRDTGVGMTPDVLAHVFEPFFTTKPPGQGTGLGLASVYGVIKQSEGYIGVDSAPDQGTLFRIYLPRLEAAAEGAAPAAAAAPAPRGSETILIVEDETTVRAVATQVLERRGYRVLQAGSGPEALALMAGGGAGVKLLLSDVIMPGMSGPELAERLVGRHPGLKVLFMSGYAEDAVSSRGALGRGAPLIMKPFTPDELARRVREVLDGAARPVA